jgi:chaperone modulatory protein CbpM
MTGFAAVVALFPDLNAPVIADWVARGWVHVEGTRREDWAFAEIDIARIGLIRTLRIEMDVDEAALPLVLSLLDQVYGLRRTLRTVARVLEDQPEGVRTAVMAAIERRAR